jgi:hypothetical protein
MPLTGNMLLILCGHPVVNVHTSQPVTSCCRFYVPQVHGDMLLPKATALTFEKTSMPVANPSLASRSLRDSKVNSGRTCHPRV